MALEQAKMKKPRRKDTRSLTLQPNQLLQSKNNNSSKEDNLNDMENLEEDPLLKLREGMDKFKK